MVDIDNVPLYVDNELDPIARITIPEFIQVCDVEETRDDLRVVYDLKHFVNFRWLTPRKEPCGGCGEVHQVLTHGCKPIAYLATLDGELKYFDMVAASRDSVPWNITIRCDVQMVSWSVGKDQLSATARVDPHEHKEFRWL